MLAPCTPYDADRPARTRYQQTICIRTSISSLVYMQSSKMPLDPTSAAAEPPALSKGANVPTGPPHPHAFTDQMSSSRRTVASRRREPPFSNAHVDLFQAVRCLMYTPISSKESGRSVQHAIALQTASPVEYHVCCHGRKGTWLLLSGHSNAGWSSCVVI